MSLFQDAVSGVNIGNTVNVFDGGFGLCRNRFLKILERKNPHAGTRVTKENGPYARGS